MPTSFRPRSAIVVPGVFYISINSGQEPTSVQLQLSRHHTSVTAPSCRPKTCRQSSGPCTYADGSPGVFASAVLQDMSAHHSSSRVTVLPLYLRVSKACRHPSGLCATAANSPGVFASAVLQDMSAHHTSSAVTPSPSHQVVSSSQACTLDQPAAAMLDNTSLHHLT